MTELVIAAVLAVAASVVLFVVLPERLRAPVLGLLGAVAGAAWALLGRRRPGASAGLTQPPSIGEAIGDEQAATVERVRVEHEAIEAEAERVKALPYDERAEAVAASARRRRR